MPVSTRSRRLPLESLSGDREAPSPSNHRTVTADLAQAVARLIRNCNPSATATRDRPPRRFLPIQALDRLDVRAGAGLDDGRQESIARLELVRLLRYVPAFR
jgi:hypothetical protein